MRLAARYVVFAALATLANLGTQRAVFAAVDDGLLLALLAGTAVGLVLKYALDRRWIFQDSASGIGAHSRRFGLYTLMGVATTALFWGTETVFWLAFRTETMRETGALLGLCLGYWAKYRLDRRFVFTDRPGPVASLRPLG